jgi:hypothetical protein
MKKISKEAMRNLIAEPALYFQNLKKDSMHSQQRSSYQHVDSDEANASSGDERRKRRHGKHKLSYSDEEKRQDSNSSGTLKKISSRARRNSSFNENENLASSQESEE